MSYTGSDPQPDTFVDNSQALVEGRLAPNGTFVADEVRPNPGQPKKEYEKPGYSNKKS